MSDGTLQTLDVSMLEDVGTGANQLIQLDSNAKIPACSAAALTNLPSPLTKSANDPTSTTNPVGGTGTVFQNTTSGEMYICTDDTAGSNVWKNIGGGSGDVKPSVFPLGENYGYRAGGAAASDQDVVEKYSFTSDAPADDVGNLTQTRQRVVGSSSTTYAYNMGGYSPWATGFNIIDKNAFASDGDSTDSGDLQGTRFQGAGTASSTHGYHAGGNTNFTSPYGISDMIEKFAFASGGNTADTGSNLYSAAAWSGGSASTTYSYIHGGTIPPYTFTDMIQKFAFANESTTADVGNLTVGAAACYEACTGSTTYGYTTGRYMASPNGPVGMETIDKFSYTSDGDATNVGDMYQDCQQGGATSSTTHGYLAGGESYDGNTRYDVIQKWTFASDGNATDVANLTVAVGRGMAANQY